MKIGIYTLPIYSNYGGILQAYALQHILKAKGHEVITINDRTEFPFWKAPFIYFKRFLVKYIIRRKNAIDVFNEKTQQKIIPIITKNTQLFVDKYIDIKDISDVIKNKSKFDILIVGSDQVWRPKYVGNISNAYLGFARSWQNIRRIAYAPSFGTDKWEYNTLQSKISKELIKKFDFISVREFAGVMLCNKYLNVKATHVLDPTMLLDAEHYKLLIDKTLIKSESKELFVYVLDKNENTIKIENEICDILGYIPFYTSTDNSSESINNRIATRVEDWLLSFINADFILTDSFHACVFSILFNKPFLAYGNKGRGLSRFNSLLQTFNLQSRMITAGIENIRSIINSPIDWEEVNSILTDQRTISINFLDESIKG